MDIESISGKQGNVSRDLSKNQYLLVTHL